MPDLFLFAYGSLVSAGSISATVGFAICPGPTPATLHGWARCWNVGSDRRSHPERTMTDESGAEYLGTMAYLGVQRNDRAECSGAVYQVTDAHLEHLARRERNYYRADVTTEVSWPAKPEGCLVVTFVPTELAVERLQQAVARHDAVIRQEYVTLVEQAFDDLGGQELGRYRQTTVPSPLPLRPLIQGSRR